MFCGAEVDLGVIPPLADVDGGRAVFIDDEMLT